MRNTRLAKLRYEDFPLKTYYKLLARPQAVAERYIGKLNWNALVTKWEEDDDSLEASRLLEDQKRVALPLMKAQKASMAIKWLLVTDKDRKSTLEDVRLPYREDPQEQIDALEKFIEKNYSQYENNLLQLEATQAQQSVDGDSDFTIEDAIATLDLGGFTVTNPNELTIGQFKAMNRAIQRNGKR
jgi:hypothetical protein